MKAKYKKPMMSMEMYSWLKRGIKDYKDADKFKRKFGVTPNYARLMYKKSMRKSKYKWKLVNSKGKILSRHLTKKNAERSQMRSGKAKVYVRKY